MSLHQYTVYKLTYFTGFAFLFITMLISLVVLCFICVFQVGAKKLKKFEKEYFALKEQQEDPIERLQVNILLLPVFFICGTR